MRTFLHWTILIILTSASFLHPKELTTYKFTTKQSGLAGNGITDIKAGDGILWLGTGNGLSRTVGTDEIESIPGKTGLRSGSVSALWVSGDTIIVAMAGDTLTQVSSTPLDMGEGLNISFDNGNSWRYIPQPGPTAVQNVTYDIEVSDDIIWITSWGGGVRKSEDWGETWLEAAPDSFILDPGGKLNHRGFSLAVGEGELWVGTAGGINKSTDGGRTWINFNTTNQQNPISGNFIVALGYQIANDKKIIWGATWKAEGTNEYYAVSMSTDGGLNWNTMLKDEKAHNFSFQDSIVYVATDNGLYKSIDYGKTWYLFPKITDLLSGEQVYSTEVYSAYASDNMLWVGTADGLARTSNNGYTWDIFRAFKPTGKGDTPRTYAYPNPFSPLRHNQIGGDGFVRLQYNTIKDTKVTLKVYDFAMDLVAAVVHDLVRPGGGDFSEVWNGRNEYGDQVANGVYFYSVELEGDGTYWGKILIIN